MQLEYYVAPIVEFVELFVERFFTAQPNEEEWRGTTRQLYRQMEMIPGWVSARKNSECRGRNKSGQRRNKSGILS